MSLQVRLGFILCWCPEFIVKILLFQVCGRQWWLRGQEACVVRGGYILAIYLSGGHLHSILALPPLTHHQWLVACDGLLCDGELVGDGGGGGNVDVPGEQWDDVLKYLFFIISDNSDALERMSKEVCRGRSLMMMLEDRDAGVMDRLVRVGGWQNPLSLLLIFSIIDKISCKNHPRLMN